MKLKSVARIPKYRSRRTKKLITDLVKELAYTTSDPGDVPAIVSQIAGLCRSVCQGTKADTIARIRERADKLRSSSDRDDLVAAAELEDIASELAEEIDTCT